MNGITYYKTQSPYRGDLTKNCSLNGNEIDSNFLNLEGRDIKNVQLDENTLKIGLYNGNTFNVDLGSHSDGDGINMVNVPLNDVTIDIQLYFNNLPSTSDPSITLVGNSYIGIQHCQIHNGKIKTTQNPTQYEQTEMSNITITPMNTLSNSFEMSFYNNNNHYSFSFTLENDIFREIGVEYNDRSYGNIKITSIYGNTDLSVDLERINIFNVNNIFSDTTNTIGKVLFYEQITYNFDPDGFGLICTNNVFPVLMSYQLFFSYIDTTLTTSNFAIYRFNT